MSKVSGGELFVRTLQQAGVDVLFTLHGGHLDSIYQACHGRPIRLIDTRHEAAAGHAADAYSRVSGKLGVAIVTAGPGFTNVLTAMASAYLDCIPMLIVAGAPPLRDSETNPLQGGFDQVAMAKPVAKWAGQVTQTHRIPSMVAQAMRIASSGRPGPVYIEIPIDVLFAEINGDAIAIPKTIELESVPCPDQASVARAIELLAQAKRPVIIAGGGALLSGADAALLEFAKTTRIPVFTNNRAHGLIAGDHALAGGPLGNLAALGKGDGERTDVALVVGARLGLYTGGATDRLLPYDTRLIHVDIDAREIGRVRDVDVPIVADCREALHALTSEAVKRAWPARETWLAKSRAARDAHREAYADATRDDAKPIHPYRAAEVLGTFIDERTIVTGDGGEAKSWVEMAASFAAGSRFLSLGYLGCLGTGMPFAIGALAAHPDKRVICVVGDGAVGLNIQEFDTMARHGLPAVTVVFNNHSWGMSAHAQDLLYGAERRKVSDLGRTRYDEVARAFGCHSEHVERLSALAPAMQRALASGKPACINVMIDYDVIAPYTKGMIGGADQESQIVLPYYENLQRQ